MDTSLIISFVGLGLSILLPLLAISYGYGKVTEIQDTHREQIKAEHLLHLQLRTDFEAHKTNHRDFKENVGIQLGVNSKSLESFGETIDDLKDTMKDFISEVKSWVKEMKK